MTTSKKKSKGNGGVQTGITEQQQKCMECRECCEWVHYPVTMLSAEVMEYFIFRGEQFYIDEGGVMIFYVHKPCQHLTVSGCDIYDTRPATCQQYMCSYGDKSVKDEKIRQCTVTMGFVMKAHENFIRQKEANQANEMPGRDSSP